MEKSNLMMIVIIVLLVALLGTVVGVVFYAFGLIRDMEAAGVGQGFERSVRTLQADQINQVMIGEPIVTNLARADGGLSNSIARVQVVVGYDNTQGRESDDANALINDNMTVIRMIALDSIGRRTVEELSSQGGRDALRDELLETLQNDFRSNMIVSVGFYEWIIN